MTGEKLILHWGEIFTGKNISFCVINPSDMHVQEKYLKNFSTPQGRLTSQNLAKVK